MIWKVTFNEVFCIFVGTICRRHILIYKHYEKSAELAGQIILKIDSFERTHQTILDHEREIRKNEFEES